MSALAKDETLPADALEQIVAWAQAGVLATRRFALAAACGTGRVARALIGRGVPTVGVDAAPAAVREAAGALRSPPAAMFAVATTEALPFREGFFGAVVDVGAFHGYADPEAIAAEWARALAPGGALVLADAVEKDQDAGGVFSAVARAARPGRVNVYYKPFEIQYFLSNAGLVVENASYYRLKRSFAGLDAEREPGGGAGSYRTLAAQAGPALRELYEVNEEGMVWRFLALTARKRA